MGDYGMTAAVDLYFTNMEQRYRRDVPAIAIRGVPSHIAAFINDLSNDASVTPPVGDLYIGTHAGADGFLFARLFRGQVDVLGDPTDITDYEVLDQALGPSQPAKIPDSLIGFQPATPPPPLTHSVHIKGCNIGRDRFRGAQQPINPFLVRLKQVFGDHVNVTAPKHFHGLLPETNHNGIFEYMEQELIVRTKAVPLPRPKRGFRGFANRNELIDAYKNAHLHYHDGTPIPDGDWAATLVPRRMVDNRAIMTTLPLGRTIENLPSVTVAKQLRIETERVDWTIPPGNIPADDAGRLAKLRASIAADARFANTHAWPMWERRGFNNFNDYMDGHHWSFSLSRGPDPPAGTLVCVGRRVDYTIVEPIVDRTVTPASARPLIYNFYPGVGSTEQPVLTGLVESNNRFFGRA
jgi:hypothetical protein